MFYPYFCSTYKFDELLKEFREETTKSWIGGETINVLRFTNDVDFCADTKNHQQDILVRINEILWTKYELQLSKKKDKFYDNYKNK